MLINDEKKQAIYHKLGDLVEQNNALQATIKIRQGKINKLRQLVARYAAEAMPTAHLPSEDSEVKATTEQVKQLACTEDCKNLTDYVERINQHLQANQLDSVVDLANSMVDKAKLLKMRVLYVAELEALAKELGQAKLEQARLNGIMTLLGVSEEAVSVVQEEVRPELVETSLPDPIEDSVLETVLPSAPAEPAESQLFTTVMDTELEGEDAFLFARLSDFSDETLAKKLEQLEANSD